MAHADPGSSRQEKQCDICLRCFARTEHLARHRRTHTKEKPFSCPYCPRAFQRSDVKAAHVKNCHAAPSGLTAGDVAPDSSSSKRARIACDHCRKLKTRCDGQQPCARCHSSARTCRYSAAPPPPSTAASLTPSEDDATAINQRRGSDKLAGLKERTPSLPLDAKPTGLQFNSSPVAHLGHFPTPQGPAGMPLLAQSHTAPLGHGTVVGDVGLPVAHLDTAMMEDFWAMPTMNTQFWFDEPEFTTFNPVFFDSNALLPNHGLSSPMQTLTSTMQEYFDRKSRHPSPSINKESKMWYSAQPNMRNYSHDVIRIFLGLFRRHVPKTFSIFNDMFHNPTKNRIHYTLAMAATGGLFCSVEGSAEVAKTMYNDARRLLLAFFNLRNSSVESTATHEDYLVTVKTFILLSIYGLCSGDKRSYEFVEVFHGDLTHSVREYSEACKRAIWQENTQSPSARLLEALHILDCYRVIIMTRPPALSWHHISQLALDSPYQGELPHLHEQMSKLTLSSRTTDPNPSEGFTLATLASLATSLWPAIYPSQNRYGTDNVVFEGSSLGKPEFAALACDNWLRSQKQPVEPNVLAIYHMMNIMLHANITTLQYFAHADSDSPARDPERSTVAREVYEWNRDGNGKIARWHAKTLISTVESAFVPSSNAVKTEQTGSRRPSDARTSPFEAPHVPYAIYYATLVLWCASSCAQSSPAHAQAHIVRGERVLYMHKVHIAQILAKVLNEIK